MSLRIFNRWFDENVEKKRNTNNNLLRLNQIAYNEMGFTNYADSNCVLHTAGLTSKDLRNYIFSARDKTINEDHRNLYQQLFRATTSFFSSRLRHLL